MVTVARLLVARGLAVVTFDFLYAHAKKRVPDKNDVLERTWEAAVKAVREKGDVDGLPLLVGGKSMGGRIATQVAAHGGFGKIAGVVLLGYPLHPPGRPAALRAAHLPGVRAPMLFIQGSRDGFGTPDELAPIVGSLSGSRVVVVEGGDHSLLPPKSKRVSLDEALAPIADHIARFAVREER
jgi:predicted alpha/beta-hydrolase family hydrolase